MPAAPQASRSTTSKPTPCRTTTRAFLRWPTTSRVIGMRATTMPSAFSQAERSIASKLVLRGLRSEVSGPVTACSISSRSARASGKRIVNAIGEKGGNRGSDRKYANISRRAFSGALRPEDDDVIRARARRGAREVAAFVDDLEAAALQ